MKVCVVATGQSMTLELAATLRDEVCVAVNNAAIETRGHPARVPWAVALAANDHAWWRAHPEAKAFPGRLFSANRIPGVEQIRSNLCRRDSSSGVLGICVAHYLYPGADEIELWGYDNHGTHYFGDHVDPLHTTLPFRYGIFETQLAELGKSMAAEGVRIVNRTPGTALRCFPCE